MESFNLTLPTPMLENEMALYRDVDNGPCPARLGVQRMELMTTLFITLSTRRLRSRTRLSLVQTYSA